MIPTIETARLKLIPPDKNCFAAYEAFYTNSEASKAYGGPITSGKTWGRLMEDLGSWYLTGFGIWAIEEKQSGEIIGTCGFWQGLGWPRELTWWLLPSSRGKGYAKEVSIAAVSHAYNEFAWDKVETYMNDNNDSAKVLVERLGGVVSKRMAFPDGLSRNMYSIPKPQ